MTHLNEGQFIDILLGEPRSAALDQHLAKCAQCQGQLAVLRGGLNMARIAEPEIPDLRLPPIKYRAFKRKALGRRLIWMAAAAMFLLSFLGFRMEVGDGGWAMQFSLLNSSKQTQSESESIAALEKRLLEAIELNSTLTQNQLDARFDEIYQEREHVLGNLQETVDRKVEGLQLQNAEQLLAVRNEFAGDIEKLKVEGKLQ